MSGVAISATPAASQHTQPQTTRVSLSCSAEQTNQAVANSLETGIPVNKKLLSEYSSDLKALQHAMHRDTAAIKECRRDVSTLNAANSEVAHAGDMTAMAGGLLFAFALSLAASGVYIIAKGKRFTGKPAGS
jgi:hypothetical protein